MLYTPSHAELAQHPKTRKLARLLGVSIPTALGHLHLLWHFALKYAQDGDITRFDDVDIAEGCMWDGDPQTLCAALHGSGYVSTSANDEPLRIWLHDWDEYGGKVIRQKEGNAERQQRYRERHGNVTPPSPNTPVTVTSPLRNALDKKRLEEKRSEETRGESAGADAPPAARAAPPQKAPRVVKHPLPDDFPLTPERRAWLEEHRPDLDFEQAHAEFCTYWRSIRLEEKGRKTDWEMTWQNGMLRSRMIRAPARASPNGYHGKPNATEGFAAIAERFRREERNEPDDLHGAIDVPFTVGEAHRRRPPRGA